MCLINDFVGIVHRSGDQAVWQKPCLKGSFEVLMMEVGQKEEKKIVDAHSPQHRGAVYRSQHKGQRYDASTYIWKFADKESA